MEFLPISLCLLCAMCVSAGRNAFEESTVVPVRLDPDLSQSGQLNAEAQEKESEKRFYRLDVFGGELFLDLEPDHTFLAPGFVFHVVGNPGSTPQPESDRGAEARCFFSGTVNGEANSAAALNLCGGLQGGFYLNGQEYFIRPLNVSGDTQPTDEDLHVIQRRSRGFMAEEGGSKCGVNEEEERVKESPQKPTINLDSNSDSKGKYLIISFSYFEGKVSYCLWSSMN